MGTRTDVIPEGSAATCMLRMVNLPEGGPDTTGVLAHELVGTTGQFRP